MDKQVEVNLDDYGKTVNDELRHHICHDWYYSDYGDYESYEEMPEDLRRACREAARAVLQKAGVLAGGPEEQ
jgi:hypothetical protein